MDTNNNPNVNTQKNSTDGLGIASMVVGIVALLLVITGIFGVILSIIAILLACFDKKKSGFKVAGLVLGIVSAIIALSISALYYTAKIVIENNKNKIMSAINDSLDDYYENNSLNDYSSYNNDWNTYSSTEQEELVEGFNEIFLAGKWEEYSPMGFSDAKSRWKFNYYDEAWNYSDDTDDTYAYGTYEIVSVKEGCEILGIDYQNINNLIKNYDEVRKEDIFCVVFSPTKWFMDGVESDPSELASKIVYIWRWTSGNSDQREAEVLAGSSGITRYFKKAENGTFEINWEYSNTSTTTNNSVTNDTNNEKTQLGTSNNNSSPNTNSQAQDNSTYEPDFESIFEDFLEETDKPRFTPIGLPKTVTY